MEYEEMIIELSAMAGWNNFAASLVGQYRSKGDLSVKQWDAAERTILNAAELAFSLAPLHGKNAGAVYVKRGPDYQGKIMEGQFIPVSTCHTDTADAVVGVAGDPRGKAVQYGRDTGRCSCCGRELTDPVSIEMGIGPVCIANWGL